MPKTPRHRVTTATDRAVTNYTAQFRHVATAGAKRFWAARASQARRDAGLPPDPAVEAHVPDDALPARRTRRPRAKA